MKQMNKIYIILLCIINVYGECVLPKEGQCNYILQNCEDVSFLINYLELLYCYNSYWIVFVCMVIGIIIIFYLLSVSSSDHFVPILTILSKHLSMSADLAGITILAIGNGAPDVFSTFVAIYNTGDVELATAEVIGSGCFVSSIIVASIVLLGKEDIKMPETLIHNISCYILALLFVYFICTTGSVSIIHSIIFILIYLLYVCFIGYITKNKPLIKISEQLDSENKTKLIDNTLNNIDEELNSSNENTTLNNNISSDKGFTSQYNILEQIKLTNWFNKILLILSIPFRFIMEFTTPHISDNRKNLLISFALSPLPICIVSQLPLKYFIIPFILSIGIILIIHFTETQIPSIIINLYGFVISVLYIYIFASELVALLQSIGVAMKIDSSILGLTVLCWGNSVGDFVSNVIVSSQGYSEMGIIASYGGPCFNLLIGLGGGVLARSILHFPKSQQIVMTDSLFFSTTYLIVQLLITLIFISINGKLNKKYAVVLICSYLLVLSFSTLSAFNVFKLFG
ncbi:hypothetical protein ENUP19_0325G0004 [Entamoeba nuttalli]|uniref:Sodium/calcium exchanger protein, putative n=2 Tax=Entamoeba nuttalli TaxID=412467 RepID=K2H9M1_ENTNP|nr:sodium/calcium exchanger protein, putative [Entamoeba nuttalli P19]EKE39294.1 sodium/calcium exchanger protein, putative [Entamoeba nuttalli P19]|eukprot:XP_008858371.1 sodium/calcium exchanger protein, putative [Entamoeba nuttalli P19]